MASEKLPRVSIGHLPTPLEPLTRLTSQLGGPEIWIKRDDQTGLVTGGNKTRKLEFLVADALEQGADTLITCGAAQSNHARQTAAAAAKFGLSRILVLRGDDASKVQGNLLIDRLLGAEVVWSGDNSPIEEMEMVAARLREEGQRPYLVPYGGSNPVGATGYVAAMEELLRQCGEIDLNFDHIVFATSSGGTQAGMLVGARAEGYSGRMLGISVEPSADALRRAVAELAEATAAHLGLDYAFSPDEVLADDSYLGEGYGIVGDLEPEAIQILARAEGILLDPVYTGRAFGGMLDLIRRGEFQTGDRVLFWHTGGIPALFAYAPKLAEA
jgi:D-cysteine desulfhydrase